MALHQKVFEKLPLKMVLPKNDPYKSSADGSEFFVEFCPRSSPQRSSCPSTCSRQRLCPRSDSEPDHFRILGQIQTRVHTLRKILIDIEMDFKVLMKFLSKLLILEIIEKYKNDPIGKIWLKCGATQDFEIWRMRWKVRDLPTPENTV